MVVYIINQEDYVSLSNDKDVIFEIDVKSLVRFYPTLKWK